MARLIAVTCFSASAYELLVGEIAVKHRAVHRKVRGIDLQDEARLMDGAILLAHLARQGVEVGLVRIVIRIQHRARDDARGGRGHEAFRKTAHGLHGVFQAPDFPRDGRGVRVVQITLGFRRILHTAALRETAHQIVHELRIFLVIATAPPFRFARETRHPLRHISLEAHALLLAVVPDIDAGLHLLFHHVAHGTIHLLVRLRFVDGGAFLAGYEETGKSIVTWQAAHME